MEMRKVFAQELENLMHENKKIVVLDADLAKADGTMPLRDAFPARAFDVGIAEANMVSVAAGMAQNGFIPFVSTFTPFATRRVADQIAVSVAYANANVKIVGTDPGIAAELNGGTHMSFEDIAMLRSFPNMVIFEPVDNVQLEQSIPQIVKYKGPVYIRMFRKDTPPVHDPHYKFNLFKADKLREGKDISIFVTGLSTEDCMKAADILSEEGIEVDLLNIHTIKPIDEKAVIRSAKKTKRVLTVENHSIYGGLYSAVAEVLARERPTKMDGVAIYDEFGMVGKLDQLKAHYKMTVGDIVEKARGLLRKR